MGSSVQLQGPTSPPVPWRGRTSQMLLVGLALSLILLRFFITSLVGIEENWNSQRVDQGYYLQLGLNPRAAESGDSALRSPGFAASMSSFGEVKDLISDGNRNPLYSLLISPFAERDWPYFTTAKLLSLCFGVLTLIVFFRFAYRQFGAGIALVAAALLSINSQFIQHASMAMCETLLVLLFIICWIFIVKGFRRWTDWTIAGLVAGLAYWTKGTASALLMAFLITIAIIGRQSALRNGPPRLLSLREEQSNLPTAGDAGEHEIRKTGVHKGRWLAFPLVFLIVIAPLWLYNAMHFGSPFYNFNYTHALWLDNWYQVHASKLSSLPTMSVYLSSHSLMEILAREWAGASLTKNLFGYSLMPWGLETSFQRQYVTWALIGIAGLSLAFYKQIWGYMTEHKEVAVSGLVLIVVTIAPISWFLPISPNPRFFLPVIPIALLFLAAGCGGLLNWLLDKLGRTGQWLRSRSLTLTSMVLIVIFGAIAIWPLRHVQANPFEVDRAKNMYTDQVLAWLSGSVGEKTTVLFGASHALPLWKYSDTFDFLTTPSDITGWNELLAYSESKNARYIIVDYETLLSRSKLMGQYFDIDQRQILIKRFPPGVALAYALDKLPANFLIFEILREDSEEQPVIARFGEDIELAGYTLHNPDAAPGQTAGLTLYWQVRGDISEDFTVFAHLLDPAGFLRGQIDSQPLRGAVPTSTWQSGMIFADRYDIPVSGDTPSGTYQIACGMYTLSNMRRLEVVGPEGDLPDNQLLIEGPLIDFGRIAANE